MTRLEGAEIQKRLAELAGWTYDRNALIKEYGRKDFPSAMAFVNEIAVHAERLDHFPEIHIHSGNKVRVILTTADKDGVTERDFVLAKLIDSFSKTEDIHEIQRPV